MKVAYLNTITPIFIHRGDMDDRTTYACLTRQGLQVTWENEARLFVVVFALSGIVPKCRGW